MAMHRGGYRRSPLWNVALLVPLVGLACLLVLAVGLSAAWGMLTLLAG